MTKKKNKGPNDPSNRNVTLTVAEWQKFDEIAKNIGLKSGKSLAEELMKCTIKKFENATND